MRGLILLGIVLRVGPWGPKPVTFEAIQVDARPAVVCFEQHPKTTAGTFRACSPEPLAQGEHFTYTGAIPWNWRVCAFAEREGLRSARSENCRTKEP